MLKNKLLVAALASAFAAPAFAETAPTLSSVLDASGVSLTGAIDYAYSHLSGSGQFTSGTNDRVFDYARNSFTLHSVDVMVAKQPAQGVGAVVELTMGKDASTIASYGTGYAGQTFDVTQAFGQYASGPLTVIAGKFVTLAGQEYIKSSTNTNYSRSILFGYAIPFTHTGARATYKMSDTASFSAGVSNGWDQATDQNGRKTLELNAALTPVKALALTASVYTGREQQNSDGTGPQGNRTLLDVVAAYTVSDSLNVVLNYDNGSQDNALASGGKAKWSGLAGYVNYQINDPWRVSFRIESFKDNDGYRTGVAQTWKEATVTVGYALAKDTELRAEVRRDTSDVAAFGYMDGIARKNQNSLGLEAIYKF